MENKQNMKTVKPKKIRIEVTEKGVLTANVCVPYFVVKMGIKLGQMSGNSKKKESAEDELERLKDIDMDAILEALGEGELDLPCLLVEVDESDKNRHVKITLE
jgi:hypothetical protein